MESFTHESDESSSCTQSDGDSTNSSNGTNPFLLCPRGNSLQVGGHGRPHDGTEDTRPFKLARVEPSGHRHYHASAMTNPQGVTTVPYAHNVLGAVHGSDGLHSSTLLSQGRSYAPSTLEDCRGVPPQVASATRPPHGGLPYLGTTQNFFTQDQWSGLRQQTYVFKHVGSGNTPSSTLLLPMSCKVDKMPINFGSNPGSFYLGLADPQPGRCRRTDGKKWRCGRAVVPEQKYCERHMHRGRGRSKAAKLAKVPTVDTNQPHSSGRPLNQPLIQLLNHLTVPVQPPSQPPDAVQQPSAPAQPLKWLQRSAQTFQQPHAHLPYLAQPLLAEPLSQIPIQSKPLDWAISQSPMQAEPLNLGQSNGRPPILAQAIPMSAVSEVKIRPGRTNGSVIAEASRVHTDDPNDVFNLDVQGLKRLLENAPCSMRSRSSANIQKQVPNVADLLNVAHIRNLNTLPKKPPSLMDILKMVDPGTTTSARTNTTSILQHQSPNVTKNSVVPANCCPPGKKLPGIGYSGTLLSLTWSDEQAAQKRNKQHTPNVPSSVGLLMPHAKEETMPLKLFKVKCEGEEGALDLHKLNTTSLQRRTEGDGLYSSAREDSKGPVSNSVEGCASHLASVVCRTSELANGSQSKLPLLVNESHNCSGSPINLEKTCLNLMEGRNQSAGELTKDATSLADGDSKSVEGSNCQKLSATLDINSSAQAEGGFHRSLIEQESSPSLIKIVSNHQETSPKSESGSLLLVEGSLDSCDSSGKSEGFLPSLVEKSPDQRGGSESPDTSSAILMKKRVDELEGCANLDINSPILVVEVECQPDNLDLGRTITSSTLPMEILQTKAALDRSSSDSSCNASSFSKSTLSLDAAALSNVEPSPHVSLAN
ncbi:hypothetical protein GOP47_0029997 [Adiantum capillus-veneris]|nr:hypothetical protein GOP47_0029997 [Adiantum capillus-veneris]